MRKLTYKHVMQSGDIFSTRKSILKSFDAYKILAYLAIALGVFFLGYTYLILR